MAGKPLSAPLQLGKSSLDAGDSFRLGFNNAVLGVLSGQDRSDFTPDPDFNFDDHSQALLNVLPKEQIENLSDSQSEEELATRASVLQKYNKSVRDLGNSGFGAYTAYVLGAIAGDPATYLPGLGIWGGAVKGAKKAATLGASVEAAGQYVLSDRLDHWTPTEAVASVALAGVANGIAGGLFSKSSGKDIQRRIVDEQLDYGRNSNAEGAPVPSSDTPVISVQDVIDNAKLNNTSTPEEIIKTANEMEAQLGISDKLKSSKVQKTAQFFSKLGLGSESTAIYALNNPVLNWVNTIVNEGVGVIRHGSTASTLSEQYSRRMRGKYRMHDVFSKWLSSQGYGVVTNPVKRTELRAQFDEHLILTRQQLTEGKVAMSDLDAVTQEGIKRLDDTYDEGFRVLRVLDPDVQPVKGYLPRVLSKAKIVALGSDKAVSIITRSIMKHFGDDGNVDTAIAVAKAMVTRALNSDKAATLGADYFRTVTGREELREALRNVYMAEKDIDAVIDLFALNKGEGGKLSQQRSRVPFGYDEELVKILDTNLDGLTDRYIRTLSGRAGLAAKGVFNKEQFDTLREAAHKASNGKDSKKIDQAFEDIWDNFSGMPQRGGTSIGVHRAIAMTNISLGGGFGLSTLSELGIQFGLFGIGRTLKHASSINKFFRMVHTGEVSDKQLKEIEVFAGNLWADHHLFRPNVIGDEVGGYIENKANVLIDQGLATASTAANYVNGMNYMVTFNRAIATKGLTNMFRRGEWETMGTRRLTELGVPKGKLKDLTANYKKYGAGDNLGLERWDEEARNIFITAVTRGTLQLSQSTLKGEARAWQGAGALALVSVLRKFSFVSFEKQLLRNIHNKDSTAALMFVYGSLWAGMVGVGRMYIEGQGRSDKDEFFKERLTPQSILRVAMMYSPMMGQPYDLGNMLTRMMGLNTGLYKEGYGVSGLPFIGDNPVLSTAAKIYQNNPLRAIGNDNYGLKQLGAFVEGALPVPWWLKPGFNTLFEKGK